MKLSYTRMMKAKLEDVTVATDGFQCLQLRWEDGNVWTWVNPERVEADLKAAGKNAPESQKKIHRERKDALCGLWDEERRYDVDDQPDIVLTWPEYLDKKLGVLLRVVNLWLISVL